MVGFDISSIEARLNIVFYYFTTLYQLGRFCNVEFTRMTVY